MRSLAFSEALRIAVMRAPCSEAVDSSSARNTVTSSEDDEQLAEHVLGIRLEQHLALVRALLRVHLRQLALGHRQQLDVVDVLLQRRDEAVVDEHDEVELAVDEGLRGGRRDRLGVGVGRPVGEAAPRGHHVPPPEAQGAEALAAGRQVDDLVPERRVLGCRSAAPGARPAR